MENSELPKKILLIDDDGAVSEALEGPLKKHNIQMIRALDLDTALYQFNQQIFEVIVVELEFGPLPGLALVQKFRQSTNEARRQAGIVLISGQQRKSSDDGLVVELGDIEVLQKPVTVIKLLPALARALARKRSIIEYEQVRTLCYDSVRKNNTQEAIEICKKNMPKLQMKGMNLMCALYEEAGMLPDALKIVDAILSKKPDDIAMNNTKGRLLLKLGETTKAREFLEKADKAAPMNMDRMKAMVDMYLKLQDPNASIDKMKQLMAMNPENPEMKFDFFRDLENHGFVEHAIGLCKETTLPTEVVRHYNNKGVLLSKEGSPANALAEYNAALKFYPTFKENYRIFFNIAIAEANQKTPESLKRAETALQKCLELAPEFEKGRTLLSNIQQTMAGRAPKAS